MKNKKSDKHNSQQDKVAEITVDKRPRSQRKEEGKAMRLAVPLASHAIWKAPDNRRDPIELLIESSVGRVPELLPYSIWAYAAITVCFLSGWCCHYGS